MENQAADTADAMRQSMEADIVCVGFGPATAGFLHTLKDALVNEDGTPALESKVMPGMPLQVICYERADDIGFGVSGVVTTARHIKASIPDFDPSSIPMAAGVSGEKVLYLMDPHGASRRQGILKFKEKFVFPLMAKDQAVELPYTPPFLRKHPGYVLSLGQFMSWIGGEIMGSGMVQIWPGTPVAAPLFEGGRVAGVRLADQGVNKDGSPDAAFMPGMDVKASLTVVGDGPVGPVGRAIDDRFGMPPGNHRRDWAVGMKMVVDLPPDSGLQPGFVLHTFGYPEPDIFGFMYVYPDNTACLGIFVPSWLKTPIRTAYANLQYWMKHPAIWKYLDGGAMRSWGAKSLLETGRRGEPFLAGDGYARIGEGSGSTNVLTGSGVDEAWGTGVMLAQAVVELATTGRDFTKTNLEDAYVARRRASQMDRELRIAEKSRDGFHAGFAQGVAGMAASGFSNGKFNWPARAPRPYEVFPDLDAYFKGVVPDQTLDAIKADCVKNGKALAGPLMEAAGWPKIEYDGKLLVSHQDALLMGGKVQAAPGFANHVRFKDPKVCEACSTKVCIEACSGQAIAMNPDGGAPLFDREKCVHCGACLWNCSKPDPQDPEKTNIEFSAGSGGLHSAEN